MTMQVRKAKYGPFHAAHQAIARDKELVDALNAIQKRIYRSISDIVLRMCIEYHFPNTQFAVRAPGRVPEESIQEYMEHLRETRFVMGAPVSRIVTAAIREWVIKNVSRVDANGRAVWYDDEERIAQRGPFDS